MKAMTKSELARAAGIKQNTLRNWLRDPYIRQQLEPLHLNPYSRILPPAAVKIICDHYVIEID